MIGPTPWRHGREALLTEVRHHPYAVLTSVGDEVTLWRTEGALVWIAVGPWGPVLASLGEPAPTTALVTELAAAGRLDDITWLHLPRVGQAHTGALPVVQRDDWDFQWTTQAPPPHPGEAAVVRLTEDDYPQIYTVLDDALPHSTSRPDDKRIRAWYGIREAGRIVAVAGDRSRGEIGFLAGIAVAGTRQGAGLGAALTTALTRALLAEFGVTSLGVMSDNVRAAQLYRRLGYTAEIPRSSVRLNG